MSSDQLPNYTAPVLPASTLTWEVSDVLLGASQESDGITFNFPEAIEILGIVPTVTQKAALAGGGLILATLDAIAVELEANQEQRITSRMRGDVAGTGLSGTQFVTLSALATDKRWLRWCLENAKPDVTAKFRWKPDVSGGAIYEDTIVSLAFIVRKLERQN
jgi:hypothetical protein